ncbi:MAG TPA: amidohydrolase family protein [Thermoanaerobaculia bacterium]|nr:amidohydrolase family protein [Thermoanaerobaculia bacterium]
MIVDVRCRLAAASDGSYLSSRNSAKSHPAGLSEEAFFRHLDRAGVRTAVSVSGNNDGLDLGAVRLPPRRTSNDEQARLEAVHPGRFLGVAGIDVGGALHDPLAELERCAGELAMPRVGIEPGRAPFGAENPADRRLHPFYERAEALGVTVFLQTSGFYGGRNLDYAHPRWIDRVADDFPELRLVCGHGCYPFVRELIAVAVRRRHVYPSPDLYVFAPTRNEWRYAVNKGLIAEQFLFASGYPLGGSLVRTVDRYLLLGFRPRRLDGVLFRNALAALGLEEDPRFAEPVAAGRRYGFADVVRAALRLAVGETVARLGGQRGRRRNGR